MLEDLNCSVQDELVTWLTERRSMLEEVQDKSTR